MLSFKSIFLITVASFAVFTSAAPIPGPNGALRQFWNPHHSLPMHLPIRLPFVPGVDNTLTPVGAQRRAVPIGINPRASRTAALWKFGTNKYPLEATLDAKVGSKGFPIGSLKIKLKALKQKVHPPPASNQPSDELLGTEA